MPEATLVGAECPVRLRDRIGKPLVGMPPRVTFVFDKGGIVRHRFDSTIRFGKHVDDALAVVKTLA